MRAWYTFQQGQCTNTNVLFWVINGRKNLLQLELEFLCFYYTQSWMAAFYQDHINWAAKVRPAEACPPRLDIAVHLIMLKSGMAKALGNFEPCETCGHDLLQRVFLSGKHWKDLFIAVSGGVRNCCCASKQHWGWQKRPRVSPSFCVYVLPPVTLSDKEWLDSIALIQVHVLLHFSRTRGIARSGEGDRH